MKKMVGPSKEMKQKVRTDILQNDVAVVRMSGSFTSDFDPNTNLSINITPEKAGPSHEEISPIPRPKTPATTIISKELKDIAKTKNTIVTGSYTSRVNPFNKELNLSDNEEEDDLSRSNCSEFTSTTSDGSGDVSLAELGLTEDYFSHPDSLFGMSSVEELEMAIDNCKKMILDMPEKSERRKKYVKKLVELRMKLQDMKEGPEEMEPRTKLVLGHRLRKKNSSSMKHYCDCCNNLIWGMLQVWYRCRECGFNCHYKCVNQIRRECVALGIDKMKYILEISPEVGLSNQQFHCAECKNHILIGGDGKEEARLCDYSGQYFCPQCHWNDSTVIPARVLHNWDFSKQNVSRKSYQLLTRLNRKPLLNVQETNPMLFNYVEELADIRKLREDIILMKAYFTTCAKAREMKLLHKLRDRQHFVDGSDMYSMLDLIHTEDGSLTERLTDIQASFAKHIKLDCLYCQAKGFICEICNSGETLFPFDFGVSMCTKCSAVFHRDCFTCIDTLCPRCERKLKKKMQKVAPDLPESESETETNYIKDEHLDVTNPFSTGGAVPKADSHSDVKELELEVDQYQNESSNIPPRDIPPAKHKDSTSSLHTLLTDSSYTDYALLGFAGAGKGRIKSMPYQEDNSVSKATSDFVSDFHKDSITENLQFTNEEVDFNEQKYFQASNQSKEFSNFQQTNRKEDPNGMSKNHVIQSSGNPFENHVTKSSGNPFEKSHDTEPSGNPFEENHVIESSRNPFDKDEYNEFLNPFS